MTARERPLFVDLRDATVDSDCQLSDVLRKAKLLASALGSQDFKNWVQWELNGFPREDDLPSYRQVDVPALGTFTGPYDRRISNYILPLYGLEPELQELGQRVPLAHPIRSIEEMAKSEKDLRRAWPAEAVLLASDRIKLSGGFVLVEAYQPLTKATLEGVLDSVRNRLLDFLIQLQEQYPDVLTEDVTTQKLPIEDVSSIFNLTIHGDHNVVAAGESVSQSVTLNFTCGDLPALFEHLRSLNVPKADLDELSKAIKDDGKPTGRSFGPCVKQWLGSMLAKAANGTWKIALASAPTLISKALSYFYGWE